MVLAGWVAALVGLGTAAPAQAHDTWLAWRAAAGAGVGADAGMPPIHLNLGTGHAYPRMESAVPWRLVAEAGCRGPAGATVPLAPQRQTREALWLTASGLPAEGALSCWARTRPQPITLTAAQVSAYLDEVNASPEVRAAWAAQQARGEPWQELYSKHARLERAAAAGTAAGPVGLPLELVLASAAPAAGAPVALQAWRDGRPAAGLALQLLNDGAPAGLWVRTDAEGRARLRLPLPGAWLVRGTDLTPPAQPGAAWTGRFVTLAFEAAPSAP